MMSIFDTVFNTQELKMFGRAIQIASLGRTLHSTAPFTIFAPESRAFTRLSTAVLRQIIIDIPLLTKIMKTHIVAGNFAYKDLLIMCKQGEQTVTLKTLAGSLFQVDLSDGIKIGDSTVISTDIQAENGTIHSIDRLIIGKLPQPEAAHGWTREFICR
jgi:uncharacterized surface protein with fasciclin (FAS1) repeats